MARSEPTDPRLKIRAMRRRDLPDVLAIERSSFAEPIGYQALDRLIHEKTTTALVAERDQIEGYLIYTLHDQRAVIVDLAVAVASRRQGVGRLLIDRLKSKLKPEGRRRLVVEVSDVNTGAHMFFRSVGFSATRVLRNYFSDNTDAYKFEYILPTVHRTKGG